MTQHNPQARPLSPHLQIYRPPITMVTSIIHRLTGGALYFGTLLVAYWLIALASGPQAFALASVIFNSWIGQIVLIGYCWAIIQHLLGGLRHFIWDLGFGYEREARERRAWMNVLVPPIATALIWAFIYLA